MKHYAFTLPVPPSANRWHRSFGGRIVTAAPVRAYQERARLLALCAGVRQIRRPATVAVSVTWYRGRKAGDLDKRLGILLDALQSVAYENDSQVVEIRAFRLDHDPEHARVDVTVDELPPKTPE